jgi:hypothetical protein
VNERERERKRKRERERERETDRQREQKITADSTGAYLFLLYVFRGGIQQGAALISTW